MTDETELKKKLATMLGAGVMAIGLAAAPVTIDLAKGSFADSSAWAKGGESGESGESGGSSDSGESGESGGSGGSRGSGESGGSGNSRSSGESGESGNSRGSRQSGESSSSGESAKDRSIFGRDRRKRRSRRSN